MSRKPATYQPIRALIGVLSYPTWKQQAPIFVLSTGRTGTSTLQQLLALNQGIISEHEPRPHLFRERKLAYCQWRSQAALFEKAFKQARGMPLLLSMLKRKQYVETSAFMTFLAPAIHELLPRSRFIFMHRHPGEVVRSGMSRGWYRGHRADANRISPCDDDPIAGEWERYSAFEKTCWYWSAYNGFCRRFLNSIARDQWFEIRCERLFKCDAELMERLFEFVAVERPSSEAIERVMKARINAQRGARFESFSEWSDVQKNTLYELAKREIDDLGYSASFAQPSDIEQRGYIPSND